MSNTSQSTMQPASVPEELLRSDFAQWKSVISRVQDPVTARLVVQFLDNHPLLKERRAGVYLAASETVQRDRIRYAKAIRTGRAAALVVRTLLRMGKAVIGFVRWAASTRQAEDLQVTSPMVTAPAAAVSSVEPSNGFDRLVFPMIVDPVTGKTPLFH